MKKFVGIILTALILLASLSLAACSGNSTSALEDKISELETLIENQNEIIEDLSDKLDKTNKLIDKNYNEIIQLTKENYDRYISLNLYFDNCFYIDEGDSSSLYCVGYISTLPKADYIFSNVTIAYQIEVVGWTVDTTKLNTELSCYGESHSSFFLHRNSSIIPTPDLYTITIKTIYGSVLTPKLP